MTVVVQPNVVTTDHKAGVQVGELVRVTRQGFERLHAAPRGFVRAPEPTGRLGFRPDRIVSGAKSGSEPYFRHAQLQEIGL